MQQNMCTGFSLRCILDFIPLWPERYYSTPNNPRYTECLARVEAYLELLEEVDVGRHQTCHQGGLVRARGEGGKAYQGVGAQHHRDCECNKIHQSLTSSVTRDLYTTGAINNWFLELLSLGSMWTNVQSKLSLLCLHAECDGCVIGGACGMA